MRALLKEIDAIPALTRFGRVARIEGLVVEVTGAQGAVSLGGQCRRSIGNNKKIPLRSGRLSRRPRPAHHAGALGQPGWNRTTLGARADFEDQGLPAIYPLRAPGWAACSTASAKRWTTRARCRPGPPASYPLKGAAPPPATSQKRPCRRQAGSGHSRPQCTFATSACAGQRMGIFAGSGVGKSTLLAMLARNSDADAIVIGLVERARPRSQGIHRGRSGRRRA